LKSIPIIGTACGWFGFAFLERNWAKDKVNFEKQLEGMARDARNGGEHGQEGKLDFLLFPEGTIVTVSQVTD
jgi:1-acyl-sn-glycerol-3-phosphate acyltransferase